MNLGKRNPANGSIYGVDWRGSVFDFARGGDPRGEGGPRLTGEQLRGGKRTGRLIFQKFAVEERVVEAGARGIGGAGAVEDGVEAGPVGRGQTHGARLTTGIELAARERECVQRLASGANCVDFAVGCGIAASGDRVHAFSDDLSIAYDERGKGPSGARRGVLHGKFNGAAKKRGVGWGGDGQLAHNLPGKRK